MNSKISEKDKKTWNEFLSNNQKLPDKDIKFKQKKTSTIKSIDLHGYTLEQANRAIEEFINRAYSDNISTLVVVTGKGLHSDNENDPYVSKDLGILKHSVPEFIKNNKEIMKKIIDIKEADIKDGGSGAFYINLKKLK